MWNAFRPPIRPRISVADLCANFKKSSSSYENGLKLGDRYEIGPHKFYYVCVNCKTDILGFTDVVRCPICDSGRMAGTCQNVIRSSPTYFSVHRYIIPYWNAMVNSDEQNARIEHDKALERAMTELLTDHTELFKQFSDNDSFRRWLSEMVFAATYLAPAAAASASGNRVSQ